MATSSGNTTTTISSSGSERDLVVIPDERKRKRMASNRESARRSRMRKQKHVDDLTAQVSSLMKDNNQVMHTITVTTQQFLNIDAENSVLRAQMNELTQRFQSLNEIANYMNTLNGSGSFEEDIVGNLGFDLGDFGIFNGYNGNFIQNNVNSWNLGYMNQPIMASANALHY